MPRTALLLVIVCWFALAAAFLFRKRPPRPREVRRAVVLAAASVWLMVAASRELGR